MIDQPYDGRGIPEYQPEPKKWHKRRTSAFWVLGAFCLGTFLGLAFLALLAQLMRLI